MSKTMIAVSLLTRNDVWNQQYLVWLFGVPFSARIKTANSPDPCGRYYTEGETLDRRF